MEPEFVQVRELRDSQIGGPAWAGFLVLRRSPARLSSSLLPTLWPQRRGRSGYRPYSRQWLSSAPVHGCPVLLCWVFEAPSRLTMLAASSYVASRINCMWLLLETKCSCTRIWRCEGVGQAANLLPCSVPIPVPQPRPVSTWSLRPVLFLSCPAGAQPFACPRPAPGSNPIPCLVSEHYLPLIPYLVLHGL